MTTKQKTRSTSYRGNRDYANHFEWTYELNRDVYQFYLKGRQTPTKRDMKRMKNYWDELHPEPSYFSEKQLRQQDNFVKSKNLVLDTNLETKDQSEEIDHTPTDIVTPNKNGENFDNQVTENVCHIEFNFDQALQNEVRDKLLQFYNEFIDKSIEDRKYVIKTFKKISKTEWDIINYIIETMLAESNDDINLWKINVMQYSAVLTLFCNNVNQLKENPQTKKKPRWLEFQ